MKQEKQKAKQKVIISIGTGLIVLGLIVMLVVGMQSGKLKEIDAELARAMTYDQLEEGEEVVEGTNNCVEFGAFFLRDLDGDGYAEKLKGTSKQIKKEDTLYLELNVLTEGSLKDATITVNSNNFYFNTVIVKDEYVKSNCIGANTKKIELNNMENGTQKMLKGAVRTGDYSQNTKMLDAIKGDTTKYSGVNQVVLTGTYVAEDGTETSIRKEIDLIVDWYGEAITAIPESYKNDNNKNHDIYLGIEVPDTIEVPFRIAIQETAKELTLSKSYIEGIIPELNGYKPLNVRISGTNVESTFDKETGKFTAQRKAELDETGKIISNAYSTTWYNDTYNEYEFFIEYPKEAYSAVAEKYQRLVIPISAYYEGYNNDNEEFNNPYKSNVVNDNITIHLRQSAGTEGKTDYVIRIGDYVKEPTHRWIVSKSEATKKYNQENEYEEKQYYLEDWRLLVDRDKVTKIIMKDTKNLLPGEEEVQQTNEFLKSDGSTAGYLEDMVKYVGLYITKNDAYRLHEDKWIRIYNDETDELLVEFTKNNYKQCNKENPYYYKEGVSHIRIETNDPQAATLEIRNIKELDNEKLTQRFTKEEFDELKYIKAKVVIYENYGTDDIRYAETPEHIASYENKMSIATVEAQPRTISTQTTSGNQILIRTLKDEKNNESGWINGTFLLKIPKEIIDLKVNSVMTNNNSVKIDNYEVYEEDGNYFIKIYTSNTIEVAFDIMVDCDITADPIISTTKTKVEMYATHEQAEDYYYKGVDQYDVNNNGNVQEQVHYSASDLELVSPSSLLTSSMVSEYDEAGTVTVAPKIAKIHKEQREARISIDLTNNYGETISDIVMIGKIPFKGNSYIINGKDLNSQYTTTMQDTGIEIPDDLKEYAKVYYTTIEKPTTDLNNTENRWVTAENVENWNDIKSYMVVLEDYLMPNEKTDRISYKINIPEGLEYNEITYCTHAIYFSLNTEEGKYRTKVESNKLGLMIATQYDLELTKYQIKTDKVVKGATYLVTDTQSQETRTAVTDENGKLLIKDLYAEKEYTIRETKTPQEYQLNGEEITINTTTDEQGNLQVSKINGTTRNISTIKEDEKCKLKLEVEDEPKARLQIIKTNKDTGEKISGAQFKITGKDKSGIIFSSNQQGEINAKGFYLGEEYTIEETKANGYFLMEPPVKFIVTREEGEYNFSLTNGEVYRAEITRQDEIPVLTLEIQNEPRPTYQLQIVKVEKNTTDGLAGAKFKIEGAGIDKAQNHTTNETGNITINGLYIGTDENDEVEYTLTETEAPQGYIKTAPIKLKAYNQGEELKVDITSGEVKETSIDGNIVSLMIEDEPVFKLVKKDGETATLLPNVKFALYAIGANAEETFATNTKGEVLGELETINGETYRVLKTDENGQIRADLAEGLYKVVELETLEKYELPEEIEERSYYFGVGNSRAGEIELNEEWQKTIEGDNTISINGIIQTSDGGYLANGYFYSSKITLPNGKVLTNQGTANNFIIKYNAEGEIEWGDSVGGTGYDYNYSRILETTDGNYILAGYTSNSITLSNGDNLTNKGSKDIVVVKYDTEGNILWSDMIGGTGNDSLHVIIEAEDGGVIIGTESTSTSMTSLKTGQQITIGSNNKGCTLQYDKNGNIEWYNALPFNITGLEKSGKDEYLVEGSIYSTTTLPNGETITPQGNDMIVAKYNTQGNIIWYDMISGTSVESYISYLNGIVATEDGGYLAAGKFNSNTLTLSNGDVFFGVNDSYQTFIIKYTEDGKIEWSKQINGEFTYDIVPTKDGGYALLNKNFGLVKFNKDGKEQWSVKDLGLNAYALEETEDGKYVIGGYSTEGITSGVIAKYDITIYPEVENLVNANKKLSQVEYKADYAEYISGSGYDHAIKAIANTIDGGYVVSEPVMSKTVTLQNGTTLTNKASRWNTVLVRYDSKGNTTWGAIFGGGNGEDYLLDVEGTKDNGFIAVGRYQSKDVVLDNGASLTNEGQDDGIVIKYDAEGNIEWHDTINGSGSQQITGVIQTEDDGYIILGRINGATILSNGESFSSNNTDVLLIKYDKDGNIEYYKKIGDSGKDEVNVFYSSIDKTTDNGFIIGMIGAGRTKFDDEYIDSGFYTNDVRGILIKCNSEGKLQWYDNIVGASGINSVSHTEDGGCIVGGYYSKNILLSNGDLLVNTSGNNNGIIIKYDDKGNIQWHKETTGNQESQILGVKELANGEIGVVGKYKQTITVDKDKTITAYNDNNFDGMILIYDENGNLKWDFTTKVINSDAIEQIEAASEGGIIVGGSTYGSMTTNENVVSQGVRKNNHKGGQDGYIIKLSEKEISPEKQGDLELKVENNRKEYNIKTKVEPINGVKGGSISGEKDFIYETVKYGDSNTKSIVMTPDTNYEIIKITINGEEQKFTANADGTYTMPIFSDVTEDKEIVVSYALSSNKIEIEKVDAEDNNIKLEGAKIRLERIPDEQDATEYEVELVTNSEGKAVTQLPYGTYRVTELEAPEGYQINTAIANIEFVEGGNRTFTIQDNENPSVIVQHVLKDRTGNYTDTKLAEDEIYHGVKGESYLTEPKLDMVGYDLEKDEDGEYVVPDNAAGVYGEGKTVVTYYYEEKQIPLTVHYYIEGTENKVPLSDNQLAQDVVKQGYKGENYTTESLTNVNEKYELVEVPSNSNGTYGEEEIVVIYYYKLKTYHITTKVVEHEETDSLGQVSKVKGGTISGEGQNPYETVVYGENAIKDLIVTPDEGYQVKTIKINGEEISFTAKEDKTVELSKLENVREDQEIEVEFEKVTGTVIVHHYITGTTTKVPAKDTGVVEDEIKTGFVGNMYATKPSENISDAYEVESSTGETNGTYTEEDIEVIYYYELRKPIISEAKALTTENTRKYVKQGEKITYKITVTNEGNLGKDVIVKDNIPEGTTFVEGSIKIGEEAKESMTAEDLANGITVNVPMAGKKEASKKDLTFEVTVNEDKTGDISNIAIVDDRNTNEVIIPAVSYETDITKTSNQDKITAKDTKVNYEIEYSATIDDFEGKAVATIVDTLPYAINEEQSELDGGTYDADTKTITWQQEIDNIDTFTSSQANSINITKTISLSYAYENLDDTTGSMKNTVEGTITLKAPNKDNPEEYETVGEASKEAEEEVSVEIPAEVKVHHYIYDAETGTNTTTKLVEDETKQGIIGQEYTTSKSANVPANYTCVNEEPENHAGKMKEVPIDVNYYYQLTTPTLENNAQKTVTAHKTDESGMAILTKENGEVTYNLTYDVSVKDYIGKATVTIVDTLPAKIDVDQSNLAEGTYDEANNTITWEEEMNDIDTFANGNYTNTITKQITVVYKEQDVLENLVNTVTGEIKTYYPENHLDKGGEEFVTAEDTETATLKQEYKANLKVVKVWDDNEDAKGKRPDSVTIKVTPSSGEEITAQLNQENNWTFEKQGLPKYDETTKEKITYTITESETQEGDLEYYEEAVITLQESQTEEVTNYQYTVTNAYKVMNTNLNTQLTKTGTQEITNANDEIDYTINLKAEIQDYIGEGKVVIVDTLPYKIDTTKSELAEGVYDDEKQTITFEQELPHINTDTAGENYQVDITKQLKLVYKDIDVKEDKLTNTVNEKIELNETDVTDEKTASFDTNINVKGKVIVKYVNKINQKEIADKEEIVDKVGKSYTTTKKQIQNYKWIESTGNETGEIKEEEQEVIYYYEPSLTYETNLAKTSKQDKITSKDANVDYEMEFNASVNDFKGKAIVSIVDTLPYPIDEEKSELNGGTYDADKQTITWQEEIDNIDTYTNGEANNIQITKAISLSYVYGNLDDTTGSMKNTVESNIEYKAPKRENPDEYETMGEDTKEAEKEISIEIPAEVKVHHYIYDAETGTNTTTKLVDDESKQGIIGQEYTTSKSSNVPANYTCVNEEPENHAGKMKEVPIDVNYYYQLTTPTLENNTQKTVTAHKTDESGMAILTKENGEVTYNLTYEVSVKDYIGKATISLVDTLPAKIDVDASNLAEGTYDEANNTITWEEEINDIDTFANGNYTNTITKQITVVYKEQDVLENLVNTVTGEIKTYYPENHLDKGGEEFVTAEDTETATLKQEYKANLKVVKVWDDNEDAKGKRPDSVTIKVTPSSGEEITAQLNQENNWTFEKQGLPKYDETTKEKITYTITESETQEGDLEYYEEAVITPQESQTDEVTNYQYTVTNAYKLMNTNLNTQLTKTGTQEITSFRSTIDYTINLKAEIQDYIGEGKVVIVDTLPYKIDVTKSELAEGVYDDEKQTITFEQELSHINTETAGENYQIDITKQLKLAYKDIDVKEDKITNTVNGKIELYETGEKDEKTASFETNVNVKGNVIVHHYISGTTTKVPAKDTGVVEDETKTGSVGSNYTTEPSKNISDAYEFASSNGQTNGTYTEDDIVVIYYYGLRESNITSSKELTTENARKYVIPGEKITYKITVTNEGNLGKDVIIKDNIPEGTTFVEGSIKIDEEAKEAMTAEDLANGITVNVPMAEKDTPSKKNLTFEVTVNEDKTGDISNTAIVDDRNTNEVIIPAVSYETDITKTSNQDKVTAKDTKVNYEIEYSATIDEFEGKAVATIVDTLPYAINEEQSELDGGTYDADTKTITWQQEIDNIDTFTSSQANSINITKTISLSYVYENLDDTTGSMKNTVEGTITLKAPNKDNPDEYETVGEASKEAEEEISVEIPAEVKVHHYIYDAEAGENTTTKLVEDETKQGIIGQEYTTSKSNNIPANYTCVNEEPENHAGKMKEAPIDVNYYYQLTTPTLENNAQKTVTAHKTDESGMAVLTKENGEVTYNLTYEVTVKDYIGKATVSLVDTLPAKIDVDASNLAEGTYDEANNTITWEEEMNDIDTFANGNYTNTITKQITVVYKEQDVLEDLTNTVTGEIKTYYPENHLDKGGEEFVTAEDTETATLKQEYKANLKVAKVWEDNENAKGKRPDSVTIKVTPSSGEEITAQLNQQNNWTFEKQGLAKYDETTKEKITYTVTESETQEGDLEYYEEAVITSQESQTDEVTNYQYTVTNTYKVMNTNLNTQLTKTGTQEITSFRSTIDYTINLKAEIQDYIGEGKVVIVDTLPYKIDVTKSELAEGVYDDEKQTITFEEELPHINTDTAKENYKMNITKQLKLAYKDIDVKEEKITNIVDGKVELYETEQKSEKTASFDTDVNVEGNVIVHHYISGTTTKVPAKGTGVVEDEIKTGSVRNTYTTEPSKNISDAYEFESSSGQTNGNYTEDDIEVIYYYQLRKPIISEAKELATENARKFVIPGEKITYKITVTNEGNLGKDVIVKDNIPEGTTFVEGSIKIGEETRGEMTKEDLARGITINVPMAGKEGASKKDLTFEVTVNEGKTGDISNVAIVDDKNTNEVIIPVVSYETNINKTSNQNKVTAKDTNVYYEIAFNATIDEFEGKAVATIVDTLPYPINEGKSQLDGGRYDANTKTITWQQEIDNIDTFTSTQANNINITKTISLNYAYENLDNTTGSMKNTVEGIIALKAPNKDNPAKYDTIGEASKEAEEEISVEIPTEVRVHHYIYDAETGANTTTKLVDDEIKQGIIGQEYTTSKSANVPANYTCVSEQPENHAGKMKEAPIDVNYYYQLTTPTLENNAQKTVTAHKTDESGMAVLTKEAGAVNYNLTYHVSIRDYMGKAMVTIVDTLPAKIDVDQSNLAGGTYNEAKHTITWKEEINNINTFANGNYTDTITKQITVVYKEQNVLENLVNTVTGEIKTYYPENHLNKGGKEFVKEEDTKTATLKQEYKANLKVVKVWDDNEDAKGKRPDSVTIKVTPSSGEEVIQQLNESNNWTYENKGLPKYDETTGRKITYTITESETEKGDLEYYEKAVITPQESQTDEVTNYQYTVTNAYKLRKTNLNTQLTKTGTKEITKADDAIDYTINLKAEIQNYIGEGKVVIVDTLPYRIDETKSNLASGIYDDEKQTITFEQELPHINTETAKESYKIDITKQLKLVYKDINIKEDKIKNTVKGKIELYETEQKDEKTVSFDTNINVQGKVIIKYVNKFNQKEIADREEIVGKVGKRYTTAKKQIENYNYIESTGNETGEIKEEEQEVIYYYEPQETFVLAKYQDQKGNTIAEDVVIKGYIGDIYKTEKKDINNYKLVEIKGEAQGVMTKNQTEVIYVYEATDLAKVIVKYLEKQPEEKARAKEIELLPSETIEGHIGDSYEVARKVVENYRAAEPEPTNASGKMTAETIEVIFYYEKIPSGKIDVKYVDIETEEEITHGENKEVYGYEITGFVGDKYEAKQIDIPYYTFVKSTDNKTGILTELEDTIICYYRKLNFNISVDKTISSITLNGRNINLSNNQLAKVEIDAKQIDSADLIIKYNIKVTNKGELAGKATVLDKLPAGCDISELPEYWNIRTDGMIESEVDLNVGESKDLTITLKWVKGQTNLGTKSNKAQIESTENAANYEESDLKDNVSEATVIIGIRTGEWMNRIMMVILVTALVGYTYIIISLRRTMMKKSK